MTHSKTAVLIGLAAVLPVAVLAAPTKTTARITPAQAEASATAKIPGKALSSKYEFEDGRWQYAVVVQGKAGLYEVEVNSTTGKVMDTERTSLAEEKSEAAADKKAAMKGHMKGHATPATEKGEAGETGGKDGANEKG